MAIAKNVVVIGTQWGDEGKGKIVDALSADFDIVARYQGGNNAGHTVMFDDKTFILHLVPSGVFHPDKIAVLGNGVACDVGCWMEACAMPGHVDNAGEMNGFLKTGVQLLDPPLKMAGARLVLPAAMPSLDMETVRDSASRTAAFEAGR